MTNQPDYKALAKRLSKMDRTTSNTFEVPAFPYAAVEHGLAAVLRLDAERQRGAFRARLKNFQRLGLVIAAGKGVRMKYSASQVHQWLVALILSEAGLDPVLIVDAIKTQWKSLAPWLREAADPATLWHADKWLYLSLTPRVMTASWDRGISLQLSAFWRFEHTKVLPGVPRGARIDNLPGRVDVEYPGWTSFINYTSLILHLETALRRFETIQKTTGGAL